MLKKFIKNIEMNWRDFIKLIKEVSSILFNTLSREIEFLLEAPISDFLLECLIECY